MYLLLILLFEEQNQSMDTPRYYWWRGMLAPTEETACDSVVW